MTPETPAPSHSPDSPTPTPGSLLRERLRNETATAHQALEAGLDLLGPATMGPQGRARMQAVLGGFHGFHAVWEPALASSLAEPGFSDPRLKLATLHDDLLALGLSADQIASLPRCDAAGALVASRAAALGSLYVLEGSTLGGKLISRTLRQAPWWPEGGLRYFDPYGEQTGPRWRETLARLGLASVAEHDALVAGALATFGLLRDWLVLLQPVPAASGNMQAR